MKINQKNIGAYVIAGLLIFILLLCFTVPVLPAPLPVLSNVISRLSHV